MEKSLNSSTQKPLQSDCFEFSGAHCSEESGWTAYLEDPSTPSAEDLQSFTFGSSSLVSDASSHPAWKISVASAGAGEFMVHKKLCLKQKPLHFFVDTSLEDTASSPDNSPKVADLGLFDANKGHDYISSSLGKGMTMEEINCEEDERNLEMGFKRKAGGYTDLKKRGLCLVPLSMFTNFMG